MNRILFTIIICFLFSITSNAQYTSIINSNTPGHTETPFAVGSNVYQFENTITFGDFERNKAKSEFISNNFNFRYGFWKEKLEASLVHKFTSQTNTDISGIEILSVGLKYLVFDYKQKRDYTYTRSWKKRNGFQYKNLIPSVAVKAQFNTPFTNSKLSDGKSSASVAVIAQSQVTTKLRLNNQVEYNSIGGDFPEFIYSISAAHAFKRLFNPYTEVRFHNIDNSSYFDIGVGTPFLASRDISIAVQYNYSFGKDVSGSVFGVNASYRLDRHYDKWITKKRKKDDDLEEEEIVEDVEEKQAKRRKKKEQEAEYLDSILDPKKREKARKKAAKAEEKALKEEAKAERKAKKRAAKTAEKENFDEDRDSSDREIETDKKADKKRLKAERKAAKAAEKEEKKRLKEEAKQRKKDEKNKKERSFVDDFLQNY